MASTIITRTINSATQNAITMSNSTWARTVALPPSWNKLRLGMRLHFNPSASDLTMTGGSLLAFGLSSGTADQYGDASTTYFVGMCIGDASTTWTCSTGYTSQGEYDGAPMYGLVRQGTTNTLSSALTPGNTLTAGAYVNSFDQLMYFLDITKGSPNYSFYMPLYCYQPITNPSGNGYTSATFLNNIIIGSPNPGGPMKQNTASVYTMQMAVSEATYGTLNAMNISWNRTDVLPEICDIAIAVLS
jgi:hypothetical protein